MTGNLADQAMDAWVLEQPGPMDTAPLRRARRPVPDVAPTDVLVRVRACGICRTDLHVCEGDLPPRQASVVPGHQVVGEVVECGTATQRFRVGDLVGIAWLRGTCGHCRYCRSGSENLCPGSRYTGWDADGGFAELAVVPEAYAYRLPAGAAPAEVAPLLCAGIIGYRALKRANLPGGGRLGIYGFGSSAHITAQIAARQGAELFVMTRGERNRRLAVEIGAAYVGDATPSPPAPLDAAILFAPAGELVPLALQAVAPGGTVCVAGIHLSDVPVLTYEKHLFHERDLRSVTANTRRDGEELLRLAERMRLQVTVTPVAFSQVDQALSDLAHGRVAGSLVVTEER